MNSKVAVLTSKESWFLIYAKGMVKDLVKKNIQAKLFTDPGRISQSYDTVFVLSYFKILNKTFIKSHKNVLVVHESDLPKGKGWSPLFWQIIEGKNKIPVVLFQVGDVLDSGDIYLKDYITLKGDELYDEIRRLQAEKTIKLCKAFLRRPKGLKVTKQKGKSTYYSRRTPKDSRISPNKALAEQFNLLRIASNDDFPAFLDHKGSRYILKIYKEGDHGLQK